MSYSIYIGNAEQSCTIEAAWKDAVQNQDVRLSLPWDGVTVAGMALRNAPQFPNDEMTGQGNGRHPGYSQWSDFCDEAGLEELFFAKHTGLMSAHPGTFMLRREHHATVRRALDAWRAKHPTSTPGFGGEYDPILARLMWLDFWMDWALTNCERPAISNT